jgi:hypothetical protein
VYFFLSYLFKNYSLLDYLKVGSKYLLISVILIALIAAIRFFYFNDTTNFMDYDNYPYFGNVYRYTGYFNSPNMVISVVCFATLFLLNSELANRSYLILLAGFIVCLSTISKEFLIYGSALLVILLQKKIKKSILFLMFSIIGLISIFLTLFVICSGKNCDKINRVLGPPVSLLEDVSVRPTSYYYLREFGWNQFLESPLFGVGMGNFQERTKEVVKRGVNKCATFDYEACDGYVGVASQIGFSYFVFLLLIALQLALALKGQNTNPLFFASTVFIVYMIFEAQLIGPVHFRHYWINLAVFNALIHRK